MSSQVVFVLGPEQLDDAARRIATRWAWYVIGGAVVTAIGLLLLFNIFEAARTLAVLVAIGLAFQGVDEIMNAPRYRPRWPAYLLGGLLLGTAVWALAWPGITLWALAVVTGIGFIATGVVELFIVFRYHHQLPNRWLFAALAIASIVTGVLAIAWPKATILVLAVVLGVRVVIEGLTLFFFGLGLRRVHRALA